MSRLGKMARVSWNWRASISTLARDGQFLVALASGVAIGALVLADHDTPAWQRVMIVGLFLPVVEEIVFRGWMQPLLLRASWGSRTAVGVSLANVATSILFAAGHLAHHDPVWAAGVIVPSLVFGYFRDKHRGITAPVILHVAFNLSLFL